MAKQADAFLISFNRIEKWLRDILGNPRNMGFSEMVRRLSKQRNLPVGNHAEDLLQMAQLRNAIVHDRIDEDFIIAEPNQWAVDKIKQIEQELLQPEKVLPRFRKNVTGFEISMPITDILATIAEEKYSQFPLYTKGRFEGLITLRALGYWFARESLKGEIKLNGRTARDLIISDGKKTNYRFVSAETTVAEIETLFHGDGLIEAILITKDGDPNGNLLGIIRPRDL
ncbi:MULTISPECIES: CBS domain-containing protein [Enterococcus]|uniref:CBS domain-containing protein n=1 Tax=Enterococcus TaxID=1350 RepID=UPI00065DE95C|nr:MULTISPECIES: CBS domain-containing protein [Enterococcus]KAF1302486.1 hypothetical protein BAU16_06620 [Enterococcus sp. JM9B]